MTLMYFLLWSLTMLFALFLGLTAEEIGRGTWQKYLWVGGETGAKVVGILHNIGADIVYNLPQCLYFVQRMVEIYLLKRNANENVDMKKQITFVNGLKDLATILEQMPVTSL